MDMTTDTAHLILIMGLPGSGKTFFSRALAEKMGVLHFNSDRARKEQRAHPSYSEEDKSKVYGLMFRKVTEALKKGKTVIADATFSKIAYRQPYLDWAKEHRVPVHVLHLHASEAVIHERVSIPRSDSDADFEVYEQIKAEYQPITVPHLSLRTDKDTLDQRLVKAIDYLSETKVRS